MSVLQVSWDAQAADFKAAVETLSNVEEVEVTKDNWTGETGYDFYRWTVRTDGLRILFITYHFRIICNYSDIYIDVERILANVNSSFERSEIPPPCAYVYLSNTAYAKRDLVWHHSLRVFSLFPPRDAW